MRRRIVAPVLALLLLLTTGCATNPATGKTEFNIVSEAEELSMGAQGHKEILGQFDVYDEKPELNAMVERIGRRLAATSPRPNLPWTFTLLDTPMVNAMALPGGYIYVTRGILERMNSEDELAGVIGHEVAHVAARHSAQQMSRAMLAQAGLMTMAVAAGQERTEKYGPFVMIGANLLFTKYSRSQETQADLLGTKYMSASGWNPHGSENMLRALLRLQGGPTGTIERYFMDHPDPQKRVDDVRREIATLETADATVTARAVERNNFVKKLDGIVTGNATTDVVFRDGVLYNRKYGMVAHTPPGWTLSNQPGSLFMAQRTDGRQQEVITAQRISTEELAGVAPQKAVRAQLEKNGLQYVDTVRAQSASGERFDIDRWVAESEGTRYAIQTTQTGTRDGAIAFVHMALAGKSSSTLEALIGKLELGSQSAFRIQPPRMHIGNARSADTWEGLATRATGDAKDAAVLANINGHDFPGTVPAGLLVKLPQEVAK